MANFLDTTPEPPYTAVIFTSIKRGDNMDGYADMIDDMMLLAKSQDGFLGFETVGEASGRAITISYWRDHEAARAFKGVDQHIAAQRLGRQKWYSAYATRIATVDKQYGYDSERN